MTEEQLTEYAERFGDYAPVRVSRRRLRCYLRQFKCAHRPLVLDLLDSVIYFSESDVRAAVTEYLTRLMGLLGLHHGERRVAVYVVKASEEGDSSEEMLSFFEDVANERNLSLTIFRGSVLDLRKLVARNAYSIVVFVDDYIGTGKQFASSYAAWKSALTGTTITKILFTVVACEEAVSKFSELGVTLEYKYLHRSSERFQAWCKLRDPDGVLQSYALEIHSKIPYGFANSGSLVVVFRNSNNNMPFLLRGTKGQRVWMGLFPRKDQILPPKP